MFVVLLYWSTGNWLGRDSRACALYASDGDRERIRQVGCNNIYKYIHVYFCSQKEKKKKK